MAKVHVTAKSAQTLNGKISIRSGDEQWITTEKTRRWARKQRAGFDAILVGIETVLIDDPSLHATPKSYPIKKIVLDSSLRLPFDAQLLISTRKQDIILVTTRRAKKASIQKWQDKGVNILIAPVLRGAIDIAWVLKRLSHYSIRRLLIEGGPKVVGSALRQNVVDVLQIYLGAKIFHHDQVRDGIDGYPLFKLPYLMTFKQMETQKIDKDILITAHVHRSC